MNKIILIGNLTRDVETGTTQNGVSYCRFTIAVNRRFSQNNEADFFNVTAWRGIADSCSKNLSKGQKVCVSGAVQIRNYETNDGQKRTSVDVTAEEVDFLTFATPNKEKDDAPKDLSSLSPVNEELPF